VLQAEKNAHLHAMLIHARCLVDFFLCDREKDDVIASDYLPDWSASKDGGPELAWLEEKLGVFIDKRVAHLTAYRRRVPKEDDAQLLADIVERVQKVVTRFRFRLAQSDSEYAGLFRGPTAGFFDTSSLAGS
jgi:hypothetical protein